MQTDGTLVNVGRNFRGVQGVLCYLSRGIYAGNRRTILLNRNATSVV